jgi:hypothetical protein
MHSDNTSEQEECFCYYWRRAKVEFVDKLHRPIGQILIKSNVVRWSPAGSHESMKLPVEAFNQLLQTHCPAEYRELEPDDDVFREWVQLRCERELGVNAMTHEQHNKLQRLNVSLDDIEKRLMLALQPQVDALQMRVDDPEDYLQEFDCEVVLCFLVGEGDPDYDAENDDNCIIKREHCFNIIKTMRDHQLHDDINWNEFENWENHPMRDDVHCWLYHDLYDHTHIGWANILRIEEISVNVKFFQQGWECRIGEIYSV